MCRHFLSSVIEELIFDQKNFDSIINENLGHQEDIYKEQLTLEFMIPMLFLMCGFNMIMEYNFAISMLKIFNDIQVFGFDMCYNF